MFDGRMHEQILVINQLMNTDKRPWFIGSKASAVDCAVWLTQQVIVFTLADEQRNVADEYKNGRFGREEFRPNDAADHFQSNARIRLCIRKKSNWFWKCHWFSRRHFFSLPFSTIGNQLQTSLIGCELVNERDTLAKLLLFNFSFLRAPRTTQSKLLYSFTVRLRIVDMCRLLSIKYKFVQRSPFASAAAFLYFIDEIRWCACVC